MRAASIAAPKQSPGVAAARTGTGDSELRPKSTSSRSACSGFVGMPVEGPARCTSTITSGNSSATASPTVSDFSTTPGPADVEAPSPPPNDAPRAAPTAAISSSAWNVRTPNDLCFDSSSRIDDGGVIGDAPGNKPEQLVFRPPLEDQRRGRDRVRPEEQVEPRQLRCGDQPPRHRRVTGDL